MNNQDERFWSEFSEDELKDPANRQMLAALRNVYSIDEDDQQSVQRAWQRIASSMNQEQQKQRVSRFDTLREFPAAFSVIGAKNPARIQRSRVRRRIDTLVALCIVFLLVGSMIGIIAFRNAQNSQVGGQGTPISTRQPTTSTVSKRLGTTLGIFSLGLSLEDLQSSGICSAQAILIHNFENYLCEGNTLDASFNLAGTQQKPGIVQLDAWGNFPGKTAEGLGLGMVRAQFNSLYQQFHPQETNVTVIDNTKVPTCLTFLPIPIFDTVVSVKDAYGTTLWVVFQGQRVVQIVLRLSSAEYGTHICYA